MSEQQRIAGSFYKLREFKECASLESVFNSVRPHYPIRKYSQVFGYNSWMEKIEDKILDRFEKIKDDIYGKFGSLWELENSFEKHIKRRIKLGHIEDEKDYIYKTLDCLANSSDYILAQHNKSWDNICYNKSKDWAVIFNEKGKMMTSYKIDRENFLGFETRHKNNNAKIKKGKTDEKFRKYFEYIRS